jgi:hypothetical protein
LPYVQKTTWAGVAISFAIIFPEYIGLFLYGFRSDMLWEEVEAA